MARHSRSGSLALAAAILLAAGSPAAPQPGTPHNPELTRLLQWLEHVDRHEPGTADLAALEVADWSRGELNVLVNDVHRISRFLRAADRKGTRKDDTLLLYDRLFTRDQLARLFDGNQTLKRAAVLHADIATFVADNRTQHGGALDGSGQVVVEDGRPRGVRYGTMHWEIGRRLLDDLAPAPGADSDARLWYRSVSAYLLRTGSFPEARKHIEKARQIFADDPAFLLDSGRLHEVFSSPGIQAAMDEQRAAESRAGRVLVPEVGTRRLELERAEREFRQALVLAPDETEGRIRLGRILGELNRHEEAAAELIRALGASPDGKQLYYAELFLGREQQALGAHAEALGHYENAAELYPNAQAPRLAAGQLAREGGDRARALRELRSLTDRSPAYFARIDPWWEYYECHRDDAERLMSRMRSIAKAGER